MGATTAFFDLPWPTNSTVVAIDRHQKALDQMWPGPRATTLCADWRRMPLDEDSCNIALCDGGLGLVDYPDGLDAVVAEVGRVIAPGGRLIARAFVPGPREEVDTVTADLLAGRIPSVNHLKIRTWFALQDDPVAGVAVSDVWDAIHTAAPDLPRRAQSWGWSAESVGTLRPYRNSDARYHLPRLDDLLAHLTDDDAFELITVVAPRYVLGDQCPTVVLRRI
jgi:SAM-dependent methyltransferase